MRESHKGLRVVMVLLDVLSLLRMSNNGSQYTSVGGFINDGSAYTLRAIPLLRSHHRASVRLAVL
jgi:hypothetical protein